MKVRELIEQLSKLDPDGEVDLASPADALKEAILLIANQPTCHETGDTSLYHMDEMVFGAREVCKAEGWPAPPAPDLP